MSSVLIIDRREPVRTVLAPQRERSGAQSLGPTRRRTPQSRSGSPHLFSPYSIPHLQRGEVPGEQVSLDALPPLVDSARLVPHDPGHLASFMTGLPNLSHGDTPQELSGMSRPADTNPAFNNNPVPEQPIPHILEVTPASGPTTGQIRVCVLGTGFPSGHRPVFGDTAAETTWRGDNACSCVLPPRHIPGTVEVTIEKVSVMGTTQYFTYEDTRRKDL